jgi:hypothetical protein
LPLPFESAALAGAFNSGKKLVATTTTKTPHKTVNGKRNILDLETCWLFKGTADRLLAASFMAMTKS